MRNRLSGLFSAVLVLSLGATAHADVAPPDSCTTVGAACNVAGPNYDQPGTCTAAKCTRASPSGSVEYDCSKCVAAATDDAGTTGKKSDDGGCSITGLRGNGALVLFAAAAALVVSRRSRR